MATRKYKIQKASRVKAIGEKPDYRAAPDKRKNLTDLQNKLDEALNKMAEMEQANDVRGVTKMNEIIANLKQTIRGM